jgi:hypothetical protein
MNSSYGKTITKPIKKEYEIVDTTEELNKMIIRNHNKIVEYSQIKGTDKWIVVKSKTTEAHKNMPQIGSEILDMSKLIMDEVMCLAEDNGIYIWLQDTDSMHVKNSDIKKLIKLFKEKYGRDLIGNQMGQFHSDFEDIKIKTGEFDEAGEEKTRSVGVLGALRSIGLGKKCYYDKLIGWDEKTKEIVFGEHYRMKGIPSKVIIERAKEMNMTIEELYDYLSTGEEVKFDLAKYEHLPSFEFTKDGTVSSRISFTRSIKFV